MLQRNAYGRVVVVFGALAALLAALPSAALVVGQLDDFEDGTTAGWTAGVALPTSPVNVPTGGPAGADDNYLRVTGTGGFGPGSRVAAFNPAQWAGDYTAAGVVAILVDVSNEGLTDLSLRLLIADAAGQSFANAAISAEAVVVPAGSGWKTVAFPVGVADLVAVAGDVGSALSNAAVLWIQHNEGTTHPPDPFLGTLGVDNIEALPEPAAAAALASGCALLAWLERRRARRR